ncbi:HIT family protein [candidate division TA06 bacterium]|nr:HIT family protein [candidate division TA06 bacterium]
MKWKAPEEWARLKAGIDCPMCLEKGLDENPHSFKVIELHRSIVRFNKNQHMKGWTTLVLKRHVTELFELGPEERAEFWNEVSLVAEALNDIYHPAKINYCIWGNIVPHLHCHLFPRFYEDDPGRPVNQNEKEVLLSLDEYRSLIKDIKDRLNHGR